MHRKAAGGTDGIVHQLGAFGQHGLLGIAFRHGAAAAGVFVLHDLQPVFIQHQGHAGGRGHGLGADVVRGRPQAAIHDHHIGLMAALFKQFHQIGLVVAQGKAPAYLPALLQQPLRQPAGIGIGYQAGEHLVAGTDQFNHGFHM